MQVLVPPQGSQLQHATDLMKRNTPYQISKDLVISDLLSWNAQVSAGPFARSDAIAFLPSPAKHLITSDRRSGTSRGQACGVAGAAASATAGDGAEGGRPSESGGQQEQSPQVNDWNLQIRAKMDCKK